MSEPSSPPPVNAVVPADPPAQTAPAKRRIKWLSLIIIAWLMTLLGLGCTIAIFGARHHWVLDLFTHWRFHLAAGMMLPTALLLCIGRWKMALFPGVIFLLHLPVLFTLYWPASQPQANGRDLKMMVSNVYTQNKEMHRVMDLIRSEQPDVIVLMEINHAWADALEEMHEQYPHRVTVPRQDNFGIAIWSRWAIASHEVIELADSRVPTIQAVIAPEETLPGAGVTIIATHPLPPMSRVYTGLRNGQLMAVAERVAAVDGPVIVAGDLNTTPWSPSMRDMVARANLVSSMDGQGYQGSWPGDGGVMRIPIDHVLVSRDIAVRDRMLGPSVRSDHLPVFVRLQLPE